MVEDREKGWWGVPAAVAWKCPDCGVLSPVEAWEERVVYCEDCGEHDGRACPSCERVFDHVWNDRLIKAQDGLAA